MSQIMFQVYELSRGGGGCTTKALMNEKMNSGGFDNEVISTVF